MEKFDRILDFGERLRARIGCAAERAIGEAEFGELAVELCRLQAVCLPVLQQLVSRRGLTLVQGTPWWRLPAIPTAMFKELDLSCLPESARTGFFLSSGTTAAARSRHWHGADSMRLYERSLMAWFEANHSVRGHRFLSLTPAPRAAPNSSLVHMFDQFQRVTSADTTGFLGTVDEAGGWQVDFDRLFRELERAARPVFLVGTAFSFVHLLDEMKARDVTLHLPAGSLLLETGGYKGRSRVLPKEVLHREMRSCLGVAEASILCEYGMSELSSQAYDTVRADGRWFRFPSWARAVTVSPETGEAAAEGEVGILRVFDLANTFSVMAVQTEDLAVRGGEGFQLLGRLAEAEARGCSLMAA